MITKSPIQEAEEQVWAGVLGMALGIWIAFVAMLAIAAWRMHT